MNRKRAWMNPFVALIATSLVAVGALPLYAASFVNLVYAARFAILRTVAVCLCLAVHSWLPLSAEATVFNGGGGSSDYNDPLNWENDQLPGTTVEDDAIVGLVGTSPPEPDGDGVAYLNPAVVDLNASPTGSPAFRDLVVGEGPDGDGTLNHTAGTLATGNTNWTFVGRNGTAAAPSIGRYNLSGAATFNGTGAVLLGSEGGPHPDPANRNQGYLTIAGDAVFNTNALGVGRNAGNYGQVDQTGGTVNVESWAAIGEIDGSEGVYNLSGGSFNTFDFGDGLSVGQNNASGTLNVSGDATVDVQNLRVGRDAGGRGLVSITGDQVSFSALSLSIGGNDGEAMAGAEGTLRFISASSISPITVSEDVLLNDVSYAGDFDMDGDVDGADFLTWQGNSAVGNLADWQANYGNVEGFAKLEVDLTTNPPPAGDILLIDVGLSRTGEFLGLPEGTEVPNSGGRTISYAFGDGNDIGLVAPVVNLLGAASITVPEPMSLSLLAAAFCLAAFRRRA